MLPETQASIEITKALIAAHPEILLETDKDARTVLIYSALELLSEVSAKMEEKFPLGFFTREDAPSGG